MKLCPGAALPVDTLRGVGPRTARDLAAAGLSTVYDVLFHFPRDYIDLRQNRSLSQGADGAPVNTVCEVVSHAYIGGRGAGGRGRTSGRAGGRTLKVYVRDETGHAALLCFGRNFLAKRLALGTRFRLYASFVHRRGELQTSVFEIADADEEAAAVLPVYPLPAGLSQTVLRRVTRSAVDAYGHACSAAVPPRLVQKYGLMDQRHAIEALHLPESPEAAERGRATFAFLELLLLQLGALRRRRAREALKRGAAGLPTALVKNLRARLPFELTADQKRAVDEILADLSSATPMARLLHGDVGSGKTLVSFLAAAAVSEAGGQVAIMAPTELLARQHADTADRLLTPLGIKVGLLIGGLQRGAWEAMHAAMESGEVDVVVGTHALFTRRVGFASLRLVIIDEQHRFGVAQRQALVEKADRPDVLFMTATPIPRTLALTAFGDMDVSAIHTMPAGRKPIKTHLAIMGKEQKVYDFVRAELASGRQAYFVYPLVGDSEAMALKSAETMAKSLDKKVYPEFSVGLIHGRMAEEQKVEEMRRFVAGKTRVLVATSVVEVGVDVANATCIVIEHAERFGLAALHQLRGRVGRSNLESYCFLVYAPEPTEDAVARLKVMKEETDGFRIAEADLDIRGPGELSGVRQSGYLRLEAANLATDGGLLEKARDSAAGIMAADPGLLLPEHAALRELLQQAADSAAESGAGDAVGHDGGGHDGGGHDGGTGGAADRGDGTGAGEPPAGRRGDYQSPAGTKSRRRAAETGDAEGSAPEGAP